MIKLTAYSRITPLGHRKALKDFFTKKEYEYYIYPYCGAFTAIGCIPSERDKIFCCDYTLYSSVLGYLAAGKDLAELGFRLTDKTRWLEQYLEDYTAETMLLAIKYAQLNKDNTYYSKNIALELRKNTGEYISQISQQLKLFLKEASGINYEIKDGLELIREWKDNPDAVVIVVPPAYKKGFTKQFGGHEEYYTWNAPDIEEYDPTPVKEKEVLDELGSIEATVIFNVNFPSYSCDDVRHDILRTKWYPLHVRKVSEKRIENFYINKKVGIGYYEAKNVKLGKDLLIWDDSKEITKWSKIDVLPIDKETAYKLRDLFIHRLGVTGADNHFVMLVDGMVHTVFGLVGKARDLANGWIYESYGISAPSLKYPRFNRLFMKILIQRQFFEDIKRFPQMQYLDMYKIKGIRTACLSRLPEVRLNRGILKLTKRVKQPDGTYKLGYEKEFENKTYKMVILEWLDEVKRYWKLKGRKKEEDVNGRDTT